MRRLAMASRPSNDQASVPAPPPFQPDIELIDNAEGNDKILREDREAAKKYLEEVIPA